MSIALLGIMSVVIIATMMMTQKTRKQQMEKQSQTLDTLEPGTWVMTSSGFYGRFVEIDGDVLVLENAQGAEMLWDRRAFASVKEPPFALNEETETADAALESAGAEAAPTAAEADPADLAEETAVSGDQEESTEK